MALLDYIKSKFIKPDMTDVVASQYEELVAKQSDTFSLIASPSKFIEKLGVPRNESVGTYRDFGRTYMREVWVFAAVKAIMEAAADVPVIVTKLLPDGTEEPLDKHPLIDLMTNVNPHTGRSMLLESTFGGLELMGNAYIEKVRSHGGQVVELYPLRADRVKIVPHAKDYIASFIYEVGGSKVTFDAKDVIHHKTWNPLDDFYGLSTLEAASLPVEVDLLAQVYNKSFFKNRAMPEGFFVIKNAGKDQLEAAQAQLEKKFKGAKNSHKIGMLGGDWQWLSLGLKQKEADFINTRKMNREDILASFRVPPVIVGVVDGQFAANVQEQLKIFWKLCILPKLQRVEDQWNDQLAPEFGDDIRIRFDKSKIEALQEDETEKVERISKKIANGVITPNEARSELGLDEVKGNKALDMFYISGNLVPIESAGQQNALPQPPKDDKPKENKAVRFKQVERWQEFVKQLTKAEDAMRVDMERFFRKQQREVVRNVERNESDQRVTLSVNGSMALKQQILLEEILFDEFDAENQLEDIGTSHIGAAVQRSGTQALATLGSSFGFNFRSIEVEQFIANKVLKFKKGINETTREEIRRQLVDAQRLGESITQIQNRIRSVYDNAAQVRSLRIARTEMVGAGNFGTLTGMKQSTIPMQKQWLSSRDDIVRDSHSAGVGVDGEIKQLGEPFSNGLEYPGDQNGSVQEVVNCRCTLIEIVE